jgi:hypothetical protein
MDQAARTAVDGPGHTSEVAEEVGRMIVPERAAAADETVRMAVLQGAPLPRHAASRAAPDVRPAVDLDLVVPAAPAVAH